MAFTACHAELDAVFPIEDLPVGAGAGGGAADANYVGNRVGGGVDHVPHVVDSGVSYRGFSIWGLAQGKRNLPDGQSIMSSTPEVYSSQSLVVNPKLALLYRQHNLLLEHRQHFIRTSCNL